MTGVPRILWKSCKLHNSGFLSVLSCAVTFWNRALGKCAVLTGQNTKKINPKVCSELVWDGWMVLRHNSATPEPPGPWSRGRCWNVINAWELGGFAGLIPSEQGRALLGHRAVEIPWAVWPPEPACSRSGIPVLGKQKIQHEWPRLLLCKFQGCFRSQLQQWLVPKWASGGEKNRVKSCLGRKCVPENSLCSGGDSLACWQALQLLPAHPSPSSCLARLFPALAHLGLHSQDSWWVLSSSWVKNLSECSELFGQCWQVKPWMKARQKIMWELLSVTCL